MNTENIIILQKKTTKILFRCPECQVIIENKDIEKIPDDEIVGCEMIPNSYRGGYRMLCMKCAYLYNSPACKKYSHKKIKAKDW